MADPPTRARRGVRSDEWPMFVAMGVFAFLSVALAILIRTWSDTAFIAQFQVSWLPLFFVISAFAFAPATCAYAWLARRVPLVPLNTAVLGVFAAVALACVGVEGRWPVFAAVLALAVVSPLANVACWSTLLERLDSRQARRLIPLIGGVSTAGAVGGGTLAAAIVGRFGTNALLWAVALLLLLMLPMPRWVAGTWRLGRSARRDDPVVHGGFRMLGQSRLLRVVGAATFLMAVCTNLVDYLLKAELQATLRPDEIALFFANFHTVTNVMVLGFQLIVVGPVINRLGVGRSFALHPLMVLSGAAACIAAPSVVAAALLRGADTLFKFTFQSNTQEMVLTPVPVVQRTQAKVLLKGVVYPLGGLTAGLLLPLALWCGPWAVTSLIVVLAVAWLWVTSRAPLAYRRQLELNLLVEVRPGLTGEPTSPDVLREALRGHLTALATLRGEGGDDAQLRRRLDDFFDVFGVLLGDANAVRETARRFLFGDDRDRADAVELLDTLFRDQGIQDAGAVLESLLARAA